MIGAILRAAADIVDPQPKLVPPVTETAYLADLNEARAEGRLEALEALAQWLAKMVIEADGRAERAKPHSDTGQAWASRAAAFDAAIEWCRQQAERQS